MKTKRIVSLVTTMVLLCVMFVSIPAYAAEADISAEKRALMIAAGEIPPVQMPTESSVAVKKDAAVEIAKTMLDDPTLFQMSNAYLNYRWGVSGGAAWGIDFMRKQAPGGNANVTVDANTGEILGFNIWTAYDGQQNFVAKMTRSEAEIIAESFVKDKLKFDMAGYELQREDPYAYGYRMGGVKEAVIYNFNYVKKIDGVLLPNDTMNIAVDGSSGKVNNYYHNSTNINLATIQLPSKDGIMTVEQAMEKYKGTMNIALQYITVYQDNPYAPAKPRAILAYVPVMTSDMMDATTGKSIGYDGNTIDTQDDAVIKLMTDPKPMFGGILPDGKAITDVEAKAVAEQYKKAAEEMLGVKFEDAGNPMAGVYYSTQNDILNYGFNKSVDNLSYNFNISINKTTGRINNLSMGKYDYMSEKMMAGGAVQAPVVNEKVSWSQGKEKALEMVKKLAPDQYGFFADQNLKEPVLSDEAKKTMREYNYYFTRVVNGILFRDNTMSINIDRETGEVKNFYFNWSDVEFPQPSGMISKDAAAAKFFDGIEARLSYFQKSTYDNKTGIQNFDPIPQLVYSFVKKGFTYGGGVLIDALSGKLIDWGGREIKMVSPTDEPQLGDSWAKRSVELLIAQGIIKNPYVGYDTELTREEAVKMLSIAKGSQYYYDMNQVQKVSFPDVTKDSDYYFFVENAVKQKIITADGGEFKGSEKITKEEFVKLLVNMVGYSDIAKYSEIFKLDGINVVNPDNIGFVAICKALDILPVKDGAAFNGGETVNYAEAATALYKALSFVK